MSVWRPSRRETLAAAALAPLAAGGCGNTGREGLVRFWAMGNEGANVPALMAGFRAANPGIAVEIQPLPWTAAHEKLLTGFAGNSLPDVSQIGNSWLSELTAIGAIAPVPDAERALLGDQFPAVLDASTIGGRARGVPWYVDARLQFVRSDLLEAAGYAAPPPRWAEWKAMLVALRRRAGEDGFAILMPINEFEQLLTFALQTPDPLLRDDDTRGNFRSRGFRGALAFYKSLFDERLAPLASATQISNVWNEFARGFFAVYLSGPWTVGDMKTRLPADMAGRWTTAAMPGPDGPGAAAPGGSSLVVFRSARDPAAAWALVRYLSQPAVQARFNTLTGDLPAQRAAWGLAGLGDDRLMRPFAEQLRRAKAVPKVPEWERIVSEMQIVAERCVRGEMTVDAACAEIDRRADRLLEKRRWMRDRGAAA